MKKYIIFGTGFVGKKAYSILGDEYVFGFCDNNDHNPGEQLFAKPVFNVGDLKTILNNNELTVVVSTTKPSFVSQICGQLSDLGISYVLLEDVLKESIKKEIETYERMNPPESFRYDGEKEYLMPLDRIGDAGDLSSYLWQDLWAARHIIDDNPNVHYDIGSRVDGFITHLLSAKIHVVLLDIRPFWVMLPDLDFICTDATLLDNISDNSLDSLSALCSLEHFGLGRYGDPIDPYACFKCFDAIQRKMKRGGLVYISVPIGKEHVEFNAHRVFAASTIVECFSGMELLEFSSCFRDEFDENIPIDKYDNWDLFGGERFGLFKFSKKG